MSRSNRPSRTRKSVQTAAKRPSTAFLLSTTTWRETAAPESCRYGVGGGVAFQAAGWQLWELTRRLRHLQVSDGHFVQFFAPSNLSPLRKNIVFVIDVSGSMWGVKMKQVSCARPQVRRPPPLDRRRLSLRPWRPCRPSWTT